MILLIMPTLGPVVSHYQNIIGTHFDCLPMLVPMASHDQKSHIVPHFDFAALMNVIVPLKCHQHHVISVQRVSYDQKSNLSPYFDCFDLRNAMVPVTVPSASNDVNGVPMVSHDQESYVALHFDLIDLTNAWYHWWCHWHPVMPMLVSKTLHNQISHVAPYS